MTRIYNKEELKYNRRELRQNMTNAEKFLWSKLRRKQLGVRFLRQYSINNFILDFCCPEKKLAIELDGYHHTEKDRKQYDYVRTITLEEYKITVLRFWNSEVLDSLETVLNRIENYLSK